MLPTGNKYSNSKISMQMKNTKQYNFGRKKIIVVSLFSGMDLLLYGFIKTGYPMIPGYSVEKNIYASLMHAANFKNVDGSSVIEFLNISKEEYNYRKIFCREKIVSNPFPCYAEKHQSIPVQFYIDEQISESYLISDSN